MKIVLTKHDFLFIVIINIYLQLKYMENKK